MPICLSEVRHEATCKLLAGLRKYVRWHCDPQEENCLPIHQPEFFPLNDYTNHMAKKNSKKKNFIIKTDDNVMVGGLPTDIVIPCDSIH